LIDAGIVMADKAAKASQVSIFLRKTPEAGV
jgi:hypothetical protein